MNFTFDQGRHVYELDGRPLVSVTQALKVLGGYENVPAHVLERKRQLGEAVDLAIQLDVAGTLDEDSISPEIEPYFSGWRSFMQHFGYWEVRTQVRGYSERYRYAGTADLLMPIKEHLSVIDVKCTAQIEKSFGPQTAAYQEILGTDDRYILHLRGDGTYRLTLMNDPDDWPIFLACLSIHNWKSK